LGIKAGSLYTHIDTKEDLLYQLLDDVYGKYTVSLARAMAENDSPEAKLRAACRGHVRVITENLDAARVALADARHLSTRRRNKIYAGFGAYDKTMGEIVTEGVDRGVFRPVDRTVFVQSLLGSLNYVSRWYSSTGVLSGDEIADRIADIHLNGVIADGSTVGNL
jgi:AcrR family transcriptional regulator